MEYPRIKACFQVTSDGIDTVQLVAEHAQYRLTSPSYAQLVPLLDGQRHCDDLIALLADRMSPARVLYTLDRLIDRGFVEDTQAGMVDEEAAYWNALGADSPAAVARLAQQSIEVIGDDASVRALFEAALTAAGLRLAARLPPLPVPSPGKQPAPAIRGGTGRLANLPAGRGPRPAREPPPGRGNHRSRISQMDGAGHERKPGRGPADSGHRQAGAAPTSAGTLGRLPCLRRAAA